jgi:hypothetical protein
MFFCCYLQMARNDKKDKKDEMDAIAAAFLEKVQKPKIVQIIIYETSV